MEAQTPKQQKHEALESALGKLNKVRINAESLLADIKETPKEVKEAISGTSMPSLEDMLANSPARIGDTCDSIDQILVEIRGIIF